MGNGCCIEIPSRYLQPKISPAYYIRENDYSQRINRRVLTTISPYCPNIVLSLLAKNTITTPVSHSITGACMLADICGFTKFSGDLCQEGVSGIDKLRRITSSFLSKFIDTIYFYYGDVIAFAGDALICYFGPIKEDDNDMTQCCIRAINCGNELKLLQTNTLSAHIAIDYGNSSLSFIGGYQNVWTYVYDGDCFSSLESCITDAKLQQLVISPTTAHLIQHINYETEQFTKALLPSGNYLVHHKSSPVASNSQIPPVTAVDLDSLDLFNVKELYIDSDLQVMKSLMADQLRKNASRHLNPQIISLVPAPILVNLTQSVPSLTEIVHVSSELREVVCMFLKLDSYNPSREIFPFESLQNFYFNYQQIIFSLGGFIRQIVTDDKGCVCIAMWGVPTASHLNNSLRSLYAASYLSDYCQKNNITISVGITTGDVYCGRIGSSTRCDYAAVGTTINLAARLMGVAKGRFIFDERTFYSFDKFLGPQCFKQLPLMQLKGRNEPFQTYEFQPSKFAAFSHTSPRRPSLSVVSADLNLSQTWVRETTASVQLNNNQNGSHRSSQRAIDDLRVSGKYSSRFPSPSAASAAAGGGGGGDAVLHSPLISGRSRSGSTNDTFLGNEIITTLQTALHQLKTWNERYQGIRLYYDEENFRDDHLIGYTEGKLVQCAAFDDHLIQILYVLGIPGTGKTEVTTQLSFYCYTESIRYIYITLSDIHYQTEYGLLRLLFSHLIGLDVFNDLAKQKTAITSLFFEIYPPTNYSMAYLIEKFSHVQTILGLSWSPTELTKSKFTRFVKLYTTNTKNSLSVRDLRPLDLTSPHPELTPSPPKQLSHSKNSFFALSRSLLNIGNDNDDYAPINDSSGGGGGAGGGGDTQYSHNKFLTILLLLRQCVQKNPPTAIILDEFQHCDNLSWAIILYLITHLQAPLLFLFTITEPFSHQMKVSQSRFFASYDQDDDGEDSQIRLHPEGQIPFLNTYEPNLIEIQRKSKSNKRFIRSISSLDPSSPQDKLLHKNANKIKIFNYLNRTYFNVFKIQLTGLKKREVKSLLQSNLQSKNVTTSLISIVTDLCEGNIYWCKAIIEFIIQFGEDSFCDTFCSFTQYSPVFFGRNNSGSNTPRSLTTERVESIIPNSSTSGVNSVYGRRNTAPKIKQEYSPSNHTYIDPNMTSMSQSSIPSVSIDPVVSFSRDLENDVIEEDQHSSPQNSIQSILLAGDVILYRLITTLMDSMTYSQKEILKYASVLGLKFSSRLLYQIIQREFENENEFYLALESLKKQNFLIEHFSKKLFPSSSASSSSSSASASASLFNYSFLSHRMRDIIYNMIPCSDSCRIHCLVAYHLEHLTLINNTYQSYYEILTFHYYIASTSPFILTKDDTQVINLIMNTTVEYLGEASMNQIPDPRPPFLISNYFLIPNNATSHCKIKSYQYSLLTSYLYFQLHEYSKSFGYLKYSVENETKRLRVGDIYDLEVNKLLHSWISLCQEYQDESESEIVTQRASVAALLEKHIQVCCFLEEFTRY